LVAVADSLIPISQMLFFASILFIIAPPSTRLGPLPILSPLTNLICRSISTRTSSDRLSIFPLYSPTDDNDTTTMILLKSTALTLVSRRRRIQSTTTWKFSGFCILMISRL
ncbi:Hypothetical predicted protein, partial [Olea europaea subsp. europaea]